MAALSLAELIPVIPASEITVTASSVHSPEQSVRHLVDGSGMIGAVHDNEGGARTMWHSGQNPASTAPATGLATSPAWVKFEFAHPQKFDQILIWNHNQSDKTDRGFRRTRIYGSTNGVAWITLTRPGTIALARASGSASEVAATIANASPDSPIKSVIIAADATDGNYGGDCFGLSAVQFVLKK